MKKIVSLSVAFILIGLNLYAGDLKVTGKLGIGTTNPQAMLDVNPAASGSTTDGFEDNNLSEYTLSGNTPYWSTTSGDKKSGTYSAKAGTISHDQSTSMKITMTVPSGNITFARKVSSEEDFDYLIFYIDGQAKDLWTGEHAWATVSYAIAAGTHSFEWVYSKDGSVNTGSDTAWIDDVTTSGAAGPAAIFSGGNVGIGTTNPQSKLSVGGDGLSDYAIYSNGSIYATAGGTGVSGVSTGSGGSLNRGVYGYGYSAGVYGHSVSTTGYGVFCTAYNTNGCGGNRSWYYSSDESLKENIATLDEALPKIKRLRGVGFNWKEDSSSKKRTGSEGKKRQIGMIAQEVMEVVPEAVGHDMDGNYVMSDGPLVALLIEAVKKQQEQIEVLMAEIEKLKKK